MVAEVGTDCFAQHAAHIDTVVVREKAGDVRIVVVEKVVHRVVEWDAEEDIDFESWLSHCIEVVVKAGSILASLLGSSLKVEEELGIAAADSAEDILVVAIGFGSDSGMEVVG